MNENKKDKFENTSWIKNDKYETSEINVIREREREKETWEWEESNKIWKYIG